MPLSIRASHCWVLEPVHAADALAHAEGSIDEALAQDGGLKGP